MIKCAKTGGYHTLDDFTSVRTTLKARFIRYYRIDECNGNLYSILPHVLDCLKGRSHHGN